jgi:hypothetical protein
VTDEHFLQASTDDAAQIAAQPAHAAGRSKPSDMARAPEKTPEDRGLATLRENLRNAKVPPLGLEPKTY